MRNEPDEAEIAEAAAKLKRAGQRALYLKRADCPAKEVPPSYFGGLPRLAPGVAWPRLPRNDPYDERKECVPTFLMQLCLDALPNFVGRDLLPKRGSLSFFADTHFEGVGNPPCRVVYDSGDCRTYPECPPPADLMLLSDYLDYTNHSWLEPSELHTRVDFRYAIEPIVFTSYREWADEPTARWDRETAHQYAYWRLQLAALEEALGPRTPVEFLWRSEEDERAGWVGWPATAVFAEHAARAVIWRLKPYSSPWVREGARAPKDAVAVYARAVREAEAWCKRLAGMAPFAPLPSEIASAFRAWFDAMLSEAFEHYFPKGADGKRTHRPRTVHHPEMERDLDSTRRYAARLLLTQAPESEAAPMARAALADWQWQWVVAEEGDDSMLDLQIPMHQLLGYGQSVQNAPLERQDQVLLLQVAGDTGLAWHNNIGCTLQFWIKPDDLAAQRFDRVEATLECD